MIRASRRSLPLYSSSSTDQCARRRETEYTRLASTQYPNRQFLAPLIIRAHVAPGKLHEADSIVTAALSLPSDLNQSAIGTAADAVHELRWHGHASEADAMAAPNS